jgi:hypothetical protein
LESVESIGGGGFRWRQWIMFEAVDIAIVEDGVKAKRAGTINFFHVEKLRRRWPRNT